MKKIESITAELMEAKCKLMAILEDINVLRKENSELKSKVLEYSKQKIYL